MSTLNELLVKKLDDAAILPSKGSKYAAGLDLYNHSSETRTVKAGDRIAQAIVIPYYGIDFITEVNELPETERGDGGFGSTGK